MPIKYIFLPIFILLHNVGFTQFVWPGDVNNNGVVNKVDLLYLGYAFGETGEARSNSVEEWVANDLPTAWNGSFPNGINYLYADCNGDGMVNELDATIIIDHIGLSHDDVLFLPDEIMLGQEGVNPECKFINPPTAVPVGQQFSLEIGLGDMDIPVESMSGFTFIINIEPAVLGMDETEFTFNPDAWIGNTEEQSIEAQQKEFGDHRLKVAYTKKDRIPESGAGPIATVSFVLETDVINLFIIDTVTFTIDSIIVLNDELEPIPMVTEILKLPVDKDLSVGVEEFSEVTKIEIYPNPNKGLLLVESEERILDRVEIINNLGQIVHAQPLNTEYFQSIDFQHLNNGFYWIKIYSAYGIKTERIHKL